MAYSSITTALERLILVTGAIVAALLLLMLGGQSVSATHCGSYGNYFDGVNWGSSGTSPAYGTYAYIYPGTDPDFCSSGYDSSAWTMLAGDGAYEYAQSGILFWESLGDTYKFWEYNDGSSYDFDYEETTTCCWAQYRTLYTNASGVVKMYWNTMVEEETPFDPVTTWDSPWHSYWSGETFYPQDDMLGQEGVPAIFAYMELNDSAYTPNWVTPSDLTLYSHGCSCYKKEWITEDEAFSIWTDR